MGSYLSYSTYIAFALHKNLYGGNAAFSVSFILGAALMTLFVPWKLKMFDLGLRKRYEVGSKHTAIQELVNGMWRESDDNPYLQSPLF